MNISVIIPALNEAPHIGLAIDRAWEAGASEVLVVDGGSDDETVALAAARRCTLIQTDPGRAHQQNAAAAEAEGDVLLFLHADTWLPPGATQEIEASLRCERIVAGGFHQRIEAAGAKYRLLERGNALRVKTTGLVYGDQGIFVRQKLFHEVGGFPEIPLMEDVRLLRLLRRRGKVALLAGPLHVDARRWQRRGVIRQTVTNWTLLLGEQLGVSPSTLARHYPHLRSPATNCGQQGIPSEDSPVAG